jgi:hypothetical protein
MVAVNLEILGTDQVETLYFKDWQPAIKVCAIYGCARVSDEKYCARHSPFPPTDFITSNVPPLIIPYPSRDLGVAIIFDHGSCEETGGEKFRKFISILPGIERKQNIIINDHTHYTIDEFLEHSRAFPDIMKVFGVDVWHETPTIERMVYGLFEFRGMRVSHIYNSMMERLGDSASRLQQRQWIDRESKYNPTSGAAARAYAMKELFGRHGYTDQLIFRATITHFIQQQFVMALMDFASDPRGGSQLDFHVTGPSSTKRRTGLRLGQGLLTARCRKSSSQTTNLSLLGGASSFVEAN